MLIPKQDFTKEQLQNAKKLSSQILKLQRQFPSDTPVMVIVNYTILLNPKEKIKVEDGKKMGYPMILFNRLYSKSYYDMKKLTTTKKKDIKINKIIPTTRI